jgi:hypothetical protein
MCEVINLLTRNANCHRNTFDENTFDELGNTFDELGLVSTKKPLQQKNVFFTEVYNKETFFSH